jgi:hypothetical protein
MMNSDIKLFLMGLGHPSFGDLTEIELHACFEYAGTLGYKVPVWAEVQIDCVLLGCHSWIKLHYLNEPCYWQYICLLYHFR